MKNLLLVLAPAPFLCALFFFLAKWNTLSEMENKIETLHHKAHAHVTLKEKEKNFVERLKKGPIEEADLGENLYFLQPEIAKLEAIPPAKVDDDIEKRLRFLKEENHLLFTIDATRKSGEIQEAELKQQGAVELNEEDLKTLLARIEQTKEGTQMLIKNFSLTKKTTPVDDEVYAIHLSLIKREAAR